MKQQQPTVVAPPQISSESPDSSADRIDASSDDRAESAARYVNAMAVRHYPQDEKGNFIISNDAAIEWLKSQGRLSRVLMCDEVGYGGCAGPCDAGVTELDLESEIIPGVFDSKKRTELQRERLVQQLKAAKHTWYAVTSKSNTIVDEIGVLRARDEAIADAVRLLDRDADIRFTNQYGQAWLDEKKAFPGRVRNLFLMDGTNVPSTLSGNDFTIITVTKGDQKHYGIAAASLLAKVTRDKWMCELHQQYPMYRWNSNKGYLALAHIQAMWQHGVSPYHRMSYTYKQLTNPIKNKFTGPMHKSVAPLLAVAEEAKRKEEENKRKRKASGARHAQQQAEAPDKVDDADDDAEN